MSNKKYFWKNISVLWLFLNQPLFKPTTVLNPCKFWHNYQILQILEECWDYDAIALLERCWERDTIPMLESCFHLGSEAEK